jgi:hypothetical protein
LADEAAEAAEGARDAAVSAANTAQAAAEDALGITEYLTPDSWDRDRVTALVEGSDLGDAQKEQLTQAIAETEGDAGLVPAVIEDIKTAFGMTE